MDEKKVLLYGMVMLTMAILLFPIIWLFLSSFQAQRDLLVSEPRLPRKFTLINYLNLARAKRFAFLFYILNSAVVASGTSIVCLLLGTPAAYAFAKLRLPGKNSLFFLILLIYMIPGVALLFPLFFVMKRFHLLDTHFSLISTYSTFTLPFIIWVMEGFFRAIPSEIDDAALVDGCSRFKVFTKIALPLSLPGLAAVTILSFIGAWNEFLYALIFSGKYTKTLPLAIAEFEGVEFVEVGQLNAAGVIAALPCVVLALVFQKYIVAGLTAGSLKG